MNAGIDVGVVILITVIALLVFTTIIVIFSRYRKCPSDKILVVYGKIGTNKDGTARSAKLSTAARPLLCPSSSLMPIWI